MVQVSSVATRVLGISWVEQTVGALPPGICLESWGHGLLFDSAAFWPAVCPFGAGFLALLRRRK